MKARSAKNKGKRLQNLLRDKLLDSMLGELEEDDIKSAIMGDSGEDIKLSPAARKLIKYSFECKNQERLHIWKALQQAEENSNERNPVLVFTRNRHKTYACIELDEFIKLMSISITTTKGIFRDETT